jgi:hypothetical protein
VFGKRSSFSDGTEFQEVPKIRKCHDNDCSLIVFKRLQRNQLTANGLLQLVDAFI